MAVTVDAAVVSAVLAGVGGIIVAIGGVIKIVVTRPRLPVAEELLEQIDELRTELLDLAAWAHDVQMVAATAGIELPPAPSALPALGRRSGERRHDRHGWTTSVRAQTGEQPAITAPRPASGIGPDTRPERRQRPTVPPR